jgi:TolA-binding protein
MAKRKKLHTKRSFSHEELRSDSFLEASAKLLAYIRKRKERFIFGLIAVVAIVSVSNRYLAGRGRSNVEAEFQMTMAHQYLLNGSYDDALLRYQSVVNQYGNSRQGREAYYWIGEAFYSLGKYDEAIDSYEQFLSASSDDDILSPSALGNIAASYEEMEEYLKAATKYREIYERFPRSSLSAWACLHSGVCFEKVEELGKAEDMYRIVIDKYVDSNLAPEAKQNLTFLTGKLQAKGLKHIETE